MHGNNCMHAITIAALMEQHLQSLFGGNWDGYCQYLHSVLDGNGNPSFHQGTKGRLGPD
jgi:hypothetical protein